MSPSRIRKRHSTHGWTTSLLKMPFTLHGLNISFGEMSPNFPSSIRNAANLKSVPIARSLHIRIFIVNRSLKLPNLYAELISKSLAASMENREEIRGEWIKYEQGRDGDAEKLFQSLEGKG